MSRCWPMLMLRGTVYYYHRAVSRQLQPLMGGKKQIWESLRTSDLDTAKLQGGASEVTAFRTRVGEMGAESVIALGRYPVPRVGRS